MSPLKIEVAGNTDVGRKRTHNEDNFLLFPEQKLFCVADGMGGHSSGEVASKIAVNEIASFFDRTGRDEDATWPYKMDRTRSYEENRLVTGIKLANLRIFERAQVEARYKGMGTTIVSIYFTKDAALVGHVGDSRVYLFRGGALQQVTEDHSLLNDYIKAKKLTPEEIEKFPHKNVIVRALGMKDQVQVDVNRLELQPGDVFLLCSDGLSGMVPDPKMTELLAATPDLEGAVKTLIDAANAAGGVDNVTVILARVATA